jgi:hypothetical protein
VRKSRTAKRWISQLDDVGEWVECPRDDGGKEIVVQVSASVFLVRKGGP